MSEDPTPTPLHAVPSFDAVFVDEYPKMVALAAAVSGSRASAEDIAQEAMARLDRNWAKVQSYDNPGGWLPGAGVDATVIVDTHEDALTLPPTSVVTRGEQDVVFLVRDGRAVETPVNLGWREVDWVEISGGISAADRVVVQGAALISDGSLLRER